MAAAMTVGRARQELTARLAAAGVPTPDVDAELLLAHVLGWSRPRVRLDRAAALPEDSRVELETLAGRRACREPLQRLVGAVVFRHLELRVDEGVLIPRPETEVLAGHAVAVVPGGGVVVDIGTGAGAVALAVADESDAGRVVATDVSPAAVACARANAERVGLAAEVRLGDLLDAVPVELRGAVDVLVSNPPYLTGAEVDAAEPEVAAHEPREALVAGPSGHEVSDRLLQAAGEWLAPGGWLLLEVDARRAPAVAERAEAAGLAKVVVLRDLAGRDRILAARHPR